MKKKIVFILPRFNIWGGAEKIAHLIMNNLDYNEFDVTLVLLQNEGDLRFTLNKEVKIHLLNVSRIRYYLLKFIPYLTKNKPDIVFTGWGEVSAYISPLIPFFPKTKFIARETNIVSQHVTRKEIRLFYKWYNNFSKIIVQSKDMQKDLIQNFNVDDKKTLLINNPIDFEEIEAKLKEVKFPSEFSKEVKNVVAVGNVSYRKGFDNLLKVFSHLKEENIVLTIIGDGADMQTFLQLKEELDLQKVQFIGRKTNPFPYLKYADLFVLSSRYEGFPNVLLEAGACGIYSIVNNCKGGINEIIEEGINGEIHPIEASEEFAIAIKKALDKQHDSIKIIDSIQNRYSTEIIIPKYRQLLKSL